MATLSMVPRPHETPTEAHARVLAELFLSVQRQVLAEQGRVPFSELTPGDTIRHAGEDWSVRSLRTDGLMLVQAEDGRCEWVESAVGETWLRVGAF